MFEICFRLVQYLCHPSLGKVTLLALAVLITVLMQNKLVLIIFGGSLILYECSTLVGHAMMQNKLE